MGAPGVLPMPLESHPYHSGMNPHHSTNTHIEHNTRQVHHSLSYFPRFHLNFYRDDNFTCEAFIAKHISFVSRGVFRMRVGEQDVQIHPHSPSVLSTSLSQSYFKCRAEIPVIKLQDN